MDFEIRKALKQDIDGINRLITENLGFFCDEDCDASKELADDGTIIRFNEKRIAEVISNFYVAVDKADRVIGCCILKHYDGNKDVYGIGLKRYLEIGSVAVDKDYRKKSIAVRLLCECCKERDQTILCEGWTYNTPRAHVHNALAHNGFKMVKDMGPSYYKNNGACPTCVKRFDNCNPDLCTAHIYIRES